MEKFLFLSHIIYCRFQRLILQTTEERKVRSQLIAKYMYFNILLKVLFDYSNLDVSTRGLDNAWYEVDSYKNP